MHRMPTGNRRRQLITPMLLTLVERIVVPPRTIPHLDGLTRLLTESRTLHRKQ
ncbi:hypothetical protein [Corynebacterium pyruviciproducens]|uniref:Uncharacterized protein n=1 Tax=Corynebacterium pyruviciproducens TaxID=598660 RepID=A0AAF1BST6_9CORY|nr:hypothetical protein [Corynebacterium pyruviciproducens]MDH4659326.1 hypothetical protein [Corynebacterium pyruviciproducens]MDK6567240.1 hypothetical protein [Corynebacterium pyruviciproducens]MDK7215393.1 hypothetical protein [Corynebacterium pyruviciproducens]WOT02524.1 hypothetical protein CYJ47_01775 [Corynebacterium pyruviciproducens]